MRTRRFSLLILTLAAHAAAAEAPRLPEAINVAGGSFETAAHVKLRSPKNPATLSGVYDSQSITDGRQWLELKVHSGGENTWLVDGILTTHYRPNPPEIVRFTNAPLMITGEHACFETGIPKLSGHVVYYTEPRDSSKFRPGSPKPAVIMDDSVYLPDANAKPPRDGKPAPKRPTAKAK